MSRPLIRMPDADVPALTKALAAALAGSGPAILPVDAAADAAAAAGAVAGALAGAVGRATPSSPAETVPDGVALVIETSGSTGVPKRVALSAAALVASARASAEWVAAHAQHRRLTQHGQHTRADGAPITGMGQWLLCLPGHYVAGTNVLVRSIHAGTDPVVMPPGHFDAAAFVEHARRLTGAERYVSMVPAQLARVVAHAEVHPEAGAALRAFDAMLIGGQAMPPTLRDRCAALGLTVVRTYGSSETVGGCVYDGEPIGETRARVDAAADSAPADSAAGGSAPADSAAGGSGPADSAASGSATGGPGAGPDRTGVLELTGPTLADGYLGDPERTAASFRVDADGTRWYRTGDLGAVAPDGRVTVLGRADNVIISGGEKVLLDAVERHLTSLPGLADAVVVAADDEQWGQVPVLITTSSDAGSRLTDIRSTAAAALGRAAAPARVVVVDAIPRLASGKPDRVALTVLARLR